MEPLFSLCEEFCDCRETLVSGVRQQKARFHDCDYCRARNALIPQAEAQANRAVPRVSAGASASAWTRAFSIAMDELARAAAQRLVIAVSR